MFSLLLGMPGSDGGGAYGRLHSVDLTGQNKRNIETPGAASDPSMVTPTKLGHQCQGTLGTLVSMSMPMPPHPC